MTHRPLVVIESPFAHQDLLVQDIYKHYLAAAAKDSLARGEAPFASHGLYTQWLDDDDPDERALGISAGLDLSRGATLSAVYIDFGISRGMQKGMDYAEVIGRPVEKRSLGEYWQTLAAWVGAR